VQKWKEVSSKKGEQQKQATKNLTLDNANHQKELKGKEVAYKAPEAAKMAKIAKLAVKELKGKEVAYKATEAAKIAKIAKLAGAVKVAQKREIATTKAGVLQLNSTESIANRYTAEVANFLQMACIAHAHGEKTQETGAVLQLLCKRAHCHDGAKGDTVEQQLVRCCQACG